MYKGVDEETLFGFFLSRVESVRLAVAVSK